MEKKGTVVVFTDLFDQTHKAFWHRTGGLIVTAAALLLALFAAGSRNRDPDDGMLWKIGMILLACGMGWVGHTGGDLHYPSDHYKDLNELYKSIVDPDAAPEQPAEGKQDAPAKAKNSAGEVSANDDSDGQDSVGQVSNNDDAGKTGDSDENNDKVGKASNEKGENIKSIDKDMTK